MVDEVRRQFRIPGILEGTKKPDYRRAVTISTVAAQRDLINLAIIAIVTPVVVGLLLNVEALGGFQAGIIISGQLLAVFMANTGGAWDNAKKVIEDEVSDPAANTGKGSERHKASVVGDTVGDPLKDTAGPALNPMIKVVNIVSLIIAPIMVKYQGLSLGTGIVIILLLGLLWLAIVRSKREAKPLEEVAPVPVGAAD
jgi:K(+)-stimulated pyrophosphate-energized sodium pump